MSRDTWTAKGKKKNASNKNGKTIQKDAALEMQTREGGRRHRAYIKVFEANWG